MYLPTHKERYSSLLINRFHLIERLDRTELLNSRPHDNALQPMRTSG